MIIIKENVNLKRGISLLHKTCNQIEERENYMMDLAESGRSKSRLRK